MASVAEILARKGSRVISIAPRATALEATLLMNRHKIGALVVQVMADAFDEPAACDRIVGIFTERDVLTRLVGKQLDPARTRVEDIMTADIACCQPETSLDEVAAVMRERRIRHLPVCDADGELRGLISIGDLNAWHTEGQEATIHFLHDYIHGRV